MRSVSKLSALMPSHSPNTFADPYRKVPYFGIWAEETADQYGKRDAMAVLADAAGCCIDDRRAAAAGAPAGGGRGRD